MSTQKNLITLCIATVFTLGLAACGSGGGGDAPVTSMMDTTTPPTTIVGQTVPSGTMIPLPEGVELPNLTVTAVMGQTIPYEGVGTFTCASAEGCSVEVVDNVITTTGEIVVDSVADDSVDALIYAALNTEPVELNELQTAQAAAADAATAAMTAAGNANTEATAAETARADAATLQTGETSEGLAEKAREQAGMAHTAYMDAKAASEAAAEADNVSDAIRAQVDAENARDAAQTAETNAGNYAQMAADAAGSELMIVGTVKTVGGTSLDAEAGSSVVVTGEGADAQTVRTGLIKSMNPMTTGPGVPTGVVFVPAADEDTTPDDGVDQTKAIPHKQAVAPRPLTIGKVVESADDMARLMIVTKYDGTNSVKVYAENTGGADLTGRLGSDGRIQTEGAASADNPNDDEFVSLKSVGTYYPVGNEGNDNNALEAADIVGAKAAAKEVFSYDDPDNAGTTIYVVLQTTTIGTTTEVVYQPVDITVVGQPDEDDAETLMEVNASIPEATDYKHIHFGAWAALGTPKKDGSQAIDDLGIGFVQSIGDGLTGADMPNNGGATYDGNWVAAVQKADPDGDGSILLTSGDALLTADFTKATIKAALTGLATLEGAIDTNTFSGTKATAMAGDPHGLDSDGEFTGSFSGGFYGAKAAEAGGVFDFTSEDAEDGAFRGAFGGDRK